MNWFKQKTVGNDKTFDIIMTFETSKSDRHFIESFRDGSFPPNDFKHEQHLYLCWLYCGIYESDDAIDQICADIQSYTRSHGAEDKYNHTLTVYLAAMILLRRDAHEDFSSWLEKNSDLKYHALDHVRQHYSSQMMLNENMKTDFVWPDLEEFPEPMQKFLEEYFA